MLRILNQRKEETDLDRSHEYKFEKDWREIVNGYQNLSEKTIKQQEAIWEIVATEHRYMKLLRYLSDLSSYITSLQGHGFLKWVENYTKM